MVSAKLFDPNDDYKAVVTTIFSMEGWFTNGVTQRDRKSEQLTHWAA